MIPCFLLLLFFLANENKDGDRIAYGIHLWQTFAIKITACLFIYLFFKNHSSSTSRMLTQCLRSDCIEKIKVILHLNVANFRSSVIDSSTSQSVDIALLL